MLSSNHIRQYFKAYFTSPARILSFTKYFFKIANKTDFIVNWHHELISRKLNEILNGTHQTNRLILNIPPRHTKTELAVIQFVALGFGLNPMCEFMHFSSSDSLVIRNTTLIRNIMESEEYKAIFPNVNLSNLAKTSIKTSQGGVLYTAPFLGQITGFGCGKLNSKKFAGAMLIDDPMKTQDALSDTIKDKINFIWANTLKSRLNDREKTPVIVTAQRIHEDDFCGYLIEKEGTIENGGVWDVVKIPAIIEKDGKEEALWELRTSLSEHYKFKELDGWVFETQFMQNPKPIEGLLFHESTTKYYDSLPENPDHIHCQIDPADEGNDFLCSVIYYVKNKQVFVADVIYTQDSTEITIPRILQQIKKHGAGTANIESNAGWALFRKQIKKEVAEMGLSTFVRSLNNHKNKETRIFFQAPSIQNLFHYSRDGNEEYQKYLKAKHSYLKMVKNQKDDGVDTDSAACDYLKRQKIIPVI